MTYLETYLINPDKTGNLHYDDWHRGYGDCCDKKFPQHIGNQAYMTGWCYALGMEAGYQNLPALLDRESFMTGYKAAQYERYCHGNGTLLNFEKL